MTDRENAASTLRMRAREFARRACTEEALENAALALCRSLDWASTVDADAMRRALNEHTNCRMELAACRARQDVLEVALAGIIGAASGPDQWLTAGVGEAIKAAKRVLGG